ncbi:MAG: hypothetical protein ABIP16_04015, partial [Thermomonas sp.]
MIIRRTLLSTALLAVLSLGHSGPLRAADPEPAPSAGMAADVPTGPLPRTVVPSEVALELKIDPAQPGFSGH